MSKTIERVAAKIQYETMSAEEKNMNMLDRQLCVRLAKAAIEALGVIVLPHDAEPEVGDVVRVTSPTIHHGNDQLDDEVGEYMIDLRGQEVLAGAAHIHQLAKDDTMEIIQRNGQPVIQDPAPSSVEGK